MFPKIGVPQNGWFRMENLIKHGMIWGYPYFWKHPYASFIVIQIYWDSNRPFLWTPFRFPFGVNPMLVATQQKTQWLGMGILPNMKIM